MRGRGSPASVKSAGNARSFRLLSPALRAEPVLHRLLKNPEVLAATLARRWPRVSSMSKRLRNAASWMTFVSSSGIRVSVRSKTSAQFRDPHAVVDIDVARAQLALMQAYAGERHTAGG